MLAERFRFSWASALLVVPLAFAPASRSEPSAICLDLPIVEVPTPARLEAPTPPPLSADQLYRAGDFTGAASWARSTDPNLAELYDQLALQWTIGMSPSTHPDDAFVALREAAKLDTVLGGAHAERLDRRIRDVLPRAAIAYYAHADRAACRQALDVAAIMGIHDSALDTLAHKLAAQP
jgi:hypothetical protein